MPTFSTYLSSGRTFKYFKKVGTRVNFIPITNKFVYKFLFYAHIDGGTDNSGVILTAQDEP